MSISNLITLASFSGQSKFSADFQNVLTRSVALRSLSLNQLQASQSKMQNRQSALQSLDAYFSNLQSAITGLSSATGLSSLTSSVSNPAVAAVSLSSGATPATYTLEVSSVGSHTQAYSSDGLQTVTNPYSQNVSTSNAFTLTVGSNTYNISANNLQGLANAINANPAYGVTASVVNDGSPSSPDYRLAVQATSLGSVNVQLNDGTQNVLTTLSTGTSATYKVNGLPNTITSNSDSVTLAPGVTANLTGTNVGSPATITVTQNSSAISTALQSFAAAYNGVVTQLAVAHGQGASPLQADSILPLAQRALSSLVTYTGGSGSALSSIGLDLQDTGQLLFNQSEFDSAVSGGLSPALQFIGDSNSGFVQAANQFLDNLQDPISGSLKQEEQGITKSLSDLSTKINNEVTRINQFQQNLLTQLSQADANIFSLESQTSYYTSYFNYGNKSSN